MTWNAGGAVMDDAEVIEMVRAVAGDGGPPLRDSPERVLAAGQRARRRRRALRVATSGVALAGVAALSLVVANSVPSGRQIELPPASSGTGTEEPSDPTEQTGANRQVLLSALGDDFVINQSGEFPQGDVTVRPGSPSAEGLPTGYAVGAHLSAGKGGNELSQFCAWVPRVEKGLKFEDCTHRTLPEGRIVYEQRSRSQPGAYKPGAYDSIRVLFAQPDGDLVVVDLWAWESESSSTPQRRAEAQAWLDVMSSRLANAATDPGVRAIHRSRETGDLRGGASRSVVGRS